MGWGLKRLVGEDKSLSTILFSPCLLIPLPPNALAAFALPNLFAVLSPPLLANLPDCSVALPSFYQPFALLALLSTFLFFLPSQPQWCFLSLPHPLTAPVSLQSLSGPPFLPHNPHGPPHSPLLHSPPLVFYIPVLLNPDGGHNI